jgi:spore germination protein YaaH
MSYNQHGSGTTPGTTAGYAWMEQVIKYALQYIPANKISLGIPSYSTYWRTRDNSEGRIVVKMNAIGFERAMTLIKDHDAELIWDKKAKISYAIFLHDWLNEYVFLEDKTAFEAKYKLMKKYDLRGISVFDLGDEDPRTWEILK